MFNPFAPLSKELLQAFIKAGKNYFVRQTFNRAKDHFDDNIKGWFLITHYSEEGHAQHHYGAITHDPYKYMYDWNNPEHQSKLTIAAASPQGYKIYSSCVVNDFEKHITNALRQKTKSYIESKLGWRPGRSQTIGFNIYINYGEVYVRLTNRTQEVRVKLEEIENMR